MYELINKQREQKCQMTRMNTVLARKHEIAQGQSFAKVKKFTRMMCMEANRRTMLAVAGLAVLGTVWLSLFGATLYDKGDLDVKVIVMVPESEKESMVEQGTGFEGPFVVGGIGDSGTRAIRSMLEVLGVDMLPERWVKTLSKDSILFINNSKKNQRWRMREANAGNPEKSLIWFKNKDGIKIAKGPKQMAEARKRRPEHFGTGLASIYRKGIYESGSKGRIGTLGYSLDIFGNEDENSPFRLPWVEDLVGGIVENHRIASMHSIREKRDDGIYVTGKWGFKHPRTAFLLPLLNQVLNQEWKFIHVIRDGRDIAYAGNSNMYHDMCCVFYHLSETTQCENSASYEENRCRMNEDQRAHGLRYLFWQDTNLQILRFGLEHLGLGTHYFPIRIEDVVVEKDKDALDALLQFVNGQRNVTLLNVLEEKVWDVFRGHESSYSGLGLSNSTRLFRMEKMRKSVGMELDDFWGLDLFGYQKHDYGISVPHKAWMADLPRRLNGFVETDPDTGESHAINRPPWPFHESPS